MNRGFVQFKGPFNPSDILQPDKENTYFIDIEIISGLGNIILQQRNLEEATFIKINPETNYLKMEEVAIKQFNFYQWQDNNTIINCIVSDGEI